MIPHVNQEHLTTLLQAVVALQQDDPTLEELTDPLCALREQGDYDPQVLGLAQLALTSVDGQHLVEAVRTFIENDDQEGLALALQVALAYKEFPSVQQILLHTEDPPLSETQLIEWLIERAILWVPCMEFEHEGVRSIATEPGLADMLHTLFETRVGGAERVWQQVLTRARALRGYPAIRITVLETLAQRKDACIALPEPSYRTGTDDAFRHHCALEGIEILRVLQVGRNDLARCSWVYLAIDTDGIVKVFKEVLEYGDDRFHDLMDLEDDVHKHIEPAQVLPHYYGTLLIEDIRFMKMQMWYGQSLLDYVVGGTRVNLDEACSIVRHVAEQLTAVHKCGVAHLDVRPQNILIGENRAQVFDLSASRFVSKDGLLVESPSFDPRYAPPESTLYNKAGMASDVFSLGVLFYQLVTGEFPMQVAPELKEGEGQRESLILRHALSYALGELEHRIAFEYSDERLLIIDQMLAKDPVDRPTMHEVALWLHDSITVLSHCPRRREPHVQTKNIALFPARMGIPHRGHIAFISRLIDLGYHVRISLQEHYTITDSDPIPKWDVRKMVARSLKDLGYHASNYSFMHTPLYEYDNELYMHFGMMPDRQDVVLVASGNEDVRVLLPSVRFLHQRALFAKQNEEYTTRSWGEQLRTHLKQGRQNPFRVLAASGVLWLRSFETLRECYAQNPVEFIPGKVLIQLRDHKGTLLLKALGLRFCSVEESLLSAARQQDANARLDGLHDRITVLHFKGEALKLFFEKTAMEDTNLIVTFRTSLCH
jgi:serine/threonine protein kinase